MVCAALTARRVLAYGIIAVLLNNAFAIIIPWLSELLLRFPAAACLAPLTSMQDFIFPAISKKEAPGGAAGSSISL